MASLTQWMEQNVPFLVLLAIVFVYEHWGGIVTFVWLTAGIHLANARTREQVSLKDKRRTGVLLMVLATLVATVILTMLMFQSEQLWLHFFFIPHTMAQGNGQRILWVVWRVVMADLIVRYASMATKVSMALCMCPTRQRRLRQLFRLAEMSTSLYRAVLPMPQWYAWLLADGAFWSLVTGFYLTFKLAAVIDQARAVLAACRATMSHQALYGRYATAEEKAAAAEESCSICHDDVNNAVILTCKHIFCEDCVCEWLERERTCPLCRAVVNTGPSVQSDGTTSLMCQIF